MLLRICLHICNMRIPDAPGGQTVGLHPLVLDCRLPWVFWEPNPDLPKEQQVLLTIETSLQSHKHLLLSHVRGSALILLYFEILKFTFYVTMVSYKIYRYAVFHNKSAETFAPLSRNA